MIVGANNRRGMLNCLIGLVFTCGNPDISDDAGRRAVEIGLARALAAVEDLQSEEFLPAGLARSAWAMLHLLCRPAGRRSHRKIGDRQTG